MSKRKSSRAADAEAKKAKLAEELALKFDCEWTSEGDGGVLVRYSESQPGLEKVASFDIDWTLTGTQSGRKFTTGKKHGVCGVRHMSLHISIRESYLPL